MWRLPFDRPELLIFFLLILSNCSSGGNSSPTPQSSQISMSPSVWSLMYSSGGSISAAPGGGFQVSFPQNASACPAPLHPFGASACPQIDYVVTASPVLSGKTTLIMAGSVSTSGNPQFNYFTQADGSQLGHVATCRPFIWRAGDNLSAQGAYGYYRWWASDPYNIVLGPGPFSITVPLDPSLWIPVGDNYPTQRASYWAQALGNAERIGFTCGGHFYGHGVNIIGGSAALIINSYTVDSSTSPTKREYLRRQSPALPVHSEQFRAGEINRR